MTTFPPTPFPRKEVTVVRGLRLLRVQAAPPWDGPAEEQ